MQIREPIPSLSEAPMEIRNWPLLLLPKEGDSVVLWREKARELPERRERLEEEKAELEEQWVA